MLKTLCVVLTCHLAMILRNTTRILSLSSQKNLLEQLIPREEFFENLYVTID